MPGRDAQRVRDVFARLLLEKSQRDDRLLNGAQLLDARPEPDVLFGEGDRVVGAGQATVQVLGLVEAFVRARQKVATPAIASDVAHDRHQHGPRVVFLERGGALLRELEQGAEALLHAVDGVFGGHPFRARHGGQGPALRADDARQVVEDVAGHGRTHNGQGAGPPADYGAHGVILRPVETFKHMEVIAMSRDRIPTVDEASFPVQVLASDVPVLVEFGAAWCAPCRALEPVLAGLARESEGRWKIVAIDMDASPGLSAKYSVRGAPTVVAFAKGTEVGRHLGSTRRETLVALIDRARSRESA